MKNKDLKDLKNLIGFKTSFKATLGFYAAQVVVGVVTLGAIFSLLIILSILLKLFNQ